MAETTFEQAKRCPKCGKPGEDSPKTTPGPKGSRVHQIFCRTELCPWYNTPWMVQVNRDGTIPPPQDHTRSPKVYEGFEGHDELAKQIMEALEIQRQMETDPDQSRHEIRNPNSR